MYGLEDKPSSEEVVYLEAAVQSDVLEDPQEEPEKPEEIIRAIEARTIEEAAADSLENISGYDPSVSRFTKISDCLCHFIIEDRLLKMEIRLMYLIH